MNSIFSHIVKSPLKGINIDHNMLENTFHFKRAIAELYDSSIKGTIARNKMWCTFYAVLWIYYQDKKEEEIHLLTSI